MTENWLVNSIKSVDERGLIVTDTVDKEIEWSHVICILGLRIPEDSDQFHLVFDVFQSRVTRFHIPESHPAFQKVLSAVDAFLQTVVSEEDRKSYSWGKIIAETDSTSANFVWWDDSYMPRGHFEQMGREPGSLRFGSRFDSEVEATDHDQVPDPTDRSDDDEAYYDWLDEESEKYESREPAEFSLFEVLYWLQAEILNGGLYQYFTNSVSDRANDAVNMLRQIKAEQAADALEEAITIAFGSECPTDTTARQEMLESSDEELLEQLNALDFNVATGWLEKLHDFMQADKG